MMIRINLLPVRAVKKAEKGRKILGIFAVVLLAAMGGNYWWYGMRDAVVVQGAAELNKVRAKIAEQEKFIGEVKNINARKTEVEKKLAVLDGLRKGRSGPVRMLDALGHAVPKKAWLRSFAEEQGGVKLTGTAISHDEVAELMRGLDNMVWTPKGLGRLVEQRRDAKTSRVELLGTPDGAIEEFPVGDVKQFFTNIELKSVVLSPPRENDRPSTVDFDITLSAHYAI